MFFGDMPTSAVAYCRVSSAQQEERETIQNQIEYATNYCKLNNIELIHIYKDDGITGTLPLNERPAGQELLRDAKEGKFKLVLVFKLDRLGRATRVILNAVHELDSYGVKVRSMTEPFDTSDASGRFLLTILAGVADLERSNILQRMELGRLRSVKKGKWVNGLPPFGYAVDENGFLVVNETPIPNTNMTIAGVVRYIFDSIASGNSLHTTADKLNILGIPTFPALYPQKKKKVKTIWRPDNVQRIVRRSAYKGECYYGKEQIATEAPAIVSEEVWDKAQRVLDRNQSMLKGNVKRQYLLRGLIKCEKCGYSYTGAFSGKRSYYSDIGRSNWKFYKLPQRCNGLSIRCEWLDNMVWEQCLSYIRNPQLVVKSVKEQIKESTTIETEIATIRSQIASNANARQRLIDLYKNGLISMEDVSAEFKRVDKEKSMLSAELSNLEAKQYKDELLAQVDSTENLLSQLQKAVDTPDVSFELKQTVIRTMVEKITVKTLSDTTARISIHFRFGDTPSTDYDRNLFKTSSRATDSLGSNSPIYSPKNVLRQKYWNIVTTLEYHNFRQ
jgi:site-specific DNA recombinase